MSERLLVDQTCLCGGMGQLVRAAAQTKDGRVEYHGWLAHCMVCGACTEVLMGQQLAIDAWHDRRCPNTAEFTT